MKKLALGTIALAAACMLPLSASADGLGIFKDSKCTKCHGIESKGISPDKADKAPDLSNASAAGDAAWMKKWLKKEVERDSTMKEGKKTKHKNKFKGSDEDLGALVDFLLTLKK